MFWKMKGMLWVCPSCITPHSPSRFVYALMCINHSRHSTDTTNEPSRQMQKKTYGSWWLCGMQALKCDRTVLKTAMWTTFKLPFSLFKELEVCASAAMGGCAELEVAFGETDSEMLSAWLVSAAVSVVSASVKHKCEFSFWIMIMLFQCL